MNLYDNGNCLAYSRAAGKKIPCIKIRYNRGYDKTCENCDGVLVKKLMEKQILGRQREQAS